MIDNDKKSLFWCLTHQPGVISKNEIIYTSGYTGYDFFDLSRLTLSPKTSGRIVKIYLNWIKKIRDNNEITKLVFTERNIGTMVIASQLSNESGLDSLIIRTKVDCSCKLCNRLRLQGSSDPPLDENDVAIIISDAVTSGGTVLDAIDIIKKNGAKPLAVVTIYDRKITVEGRTARERILNEDVDFYSVITRDELLAFGYTMPTKEDIKQKDFIEIINKELELSDEEKEKLEETVLLYTAHILDEKIENVRKFDDKSLIKFKNIALSNILQTRSKTLLLSEALVNK